MNYSESIRIMIEKLNKDDIALFTTGHISRNAFSCRDRDANLYMIGSMGLLSSVGLGMALNTDKRVFVFDGDGSLMMDLGTMAMIGARKPGNLFHILLDNGAYESTGGQPTMSGSIDFAGLSRAAGYSHFAKAGSARELEDEFEKMQKIPGPCFLRVSIEALKGPVAGRVSIEPSAMASRIRKTIAGKTA